MKCLSRLLLAPALAAVLLLPCSPTNAARRVGVSAYDGTWSVAIYTQHGNCGSVRVAHRLWLAQYGPRPVTTQLVERLAVAVYR
jgi:hypothetical protein